MLSRAIWTDRPEQKSVDTVQMFVKCAISDLSKYHNNPEYWDRQAWANRVDPDQMPNNTASDQGLHHLHLCKIDYFIF